MARFPKGLLLLAALLELLILTVSGRAATVRPSVPLPQISNSRNVDVYHTGVRVEVPNVLGLVRMEPPREDTSKKQKPKPQKRQSPQPGK